MFEGFLLLHIWVEFHRGATAARATKAWRAMPWVPAPGQVGKGALAWGTQGGGEPPLSHHLSSPSSAARREQPSPAHHPGKPWDPPTPRSFLPPPPTRPPLGWG